MTIAVSIIIVGINYSISFIKNGGSSHDVVRVLQTHDWRIILIITGDKYGKRQRDYDIVGREISKVLSSRSKYGGK